MNRANCGVLILQGWASRTYGEIKGMEKPEPEGWGPLITTDWLAAHLGDADLRGVDMRGSVSTRPIAPGVEEAAYRGALEEYRAGHIPGAVYIDWTSDIVDPDDPV